MKRRWFLLMMGFIGFVLTISGIMLNEALALGVGTSIMVTCMIVLVVLDNWTLDKTITYGGKE